jgi:hypothetical protein
MFRIFLEGFACSVRVVLLTSGYHTPRNIFDPDLHPLLVVDQGITLAIARADLWIVGLCADQFPTPVGTRLPYLCLAKSVAFVLASELVGECLAAYVAEGIDIEQARRFQAMGLNPALAKMWLDDERLLQ